MFGKKYVRVIATRRLETCKVLKDPNKLERLYMNGYAFKMELYTLKHSEHSRNVMKYFKNVRTDASFFPKKCVECALEKNILYTHNLFN